MESIRIVESQTLLCNDARNMAFDICVQAVKEHTGLPVVFAQNLHSCKYYADMLRMKCFEKVIENANHGEK